MVLTIIAMPVKEKGRVAGGEGEERQRERAVICVTRCMVTVCAPVITLVFS